MSEVPNRCSVTCYVRMVPVAWLNPKSVHAELCDDESAGGGTIGRCRCGGAL